MRALLLLLLLLLLLVGCAAPREPATPAPSPGWKAQAETRAEIELGEQIDRQLGASFGFYGERRLCAYVEQIGRRVASGAQRRDISFSFRVIDDPAVNAFAVPGGFIYVTRGLLAHLGSEAELAGVLAHELVHVDRRHALRQHAWQADRAPSWTGADSVRFYQRSRDNEREADALAIRHLVRLGYDPGAMGSLLERLGRVERELAESDESDEDDESGWLASHPATAARIARAAHAVGMRHSGRLGIEPYLNSIDGMSYGENPRRGFVDGSAWVLPDARLAFDAPSGWESSGSAQVFSAKRPDQAAYLILMRVALADVDPGRLAGSEQQQIAGRRAIWAPVEVDAEYAARVAMIDLGREQVLLIATARRKSAGESELDQLLSRFRAVDGRAEERPVSRLRIVRLERRGTLAGLGAKTTLPLDELARLNGVAPATPLAARSPLKLVR